MKKSPMVPRAVLNPNAHEYLHIIEYKDFNTYLAIQKMLEIINKQQSRPTKEQYEIINYLLEEFEKEFENAKTSKGKPLIKYKYLEREYRTK